MNIAEAQSQLEKAKAEQIIADTPLMDGIESFTVELDEDHSGDPAMWLIFRMKHGLDPDDQWLDHFNEYTHQLGMRIIRSGLTRFPYTQLRPAA